MMRIFEQPRAGHKGSIFLALLAAFACWGVSAAQAQRVIASTNPARSELITAAVAPSLPPAATLAQATVPAPVPEPSLGGNRRSLGRFEISQYGNAVSNHFGQWYGGGLHLFLDPSRRLNLMAEAIYERRPGEVEQTGVFAANIHWSSWFSTSLGVSGGGPDNSAAFFPRIRYDVNGSLRTPIPGFWLTGGWTRLEYGNPVSGRIARGGFIQYAGKVVLQGMVNFNNARPGNRKSVYGSGALQYGQEGHYWVGVNAGGGREAWQTLGLFPFNAEFSGYNLSFFTRKWFTPSFGMVFTYNYFVKHTAYHYNGGEVRFFWQF